MSPTAERTAAVTRLFLSLAAGVLFIAVGLLRGDMALVALGAGVLGLPGLTKGADRDG